jgi:hypothetical protein
MIACKRSNLFPMPATPIHREPAGRCCGHSVRLGAEPRGIRRLSRLLPLLDALEGLVGLAPGSSDKPRARLGSVAHVG